VTLGDGNGINHLVLLENSVDLNWLLEQTVAKVNLVCCATTINLDLHQVSLLLLERRLGDLGVCEDSDDGAVFLDSFDFTRDGGALLGVLLGVLGESLLLRLVPVLVEASLELLAQVFGPNGGERSQTSWCLDVTNKTNDDHLQAISVYVLTITPRSSCAYWWCLDDCDSLNDLFLVHLGTWSVEISDDGGHAGLVAHGCGKVDWLLGVILREATITFSFGSYEHMTLDHQPLHLSAVSCRSLSRQESQRTWESISRCFPGRFQT